MDDFSKYMHLTCNQNTQNVIQTNTNEGTTNELLYLQI
jgi:hypothetical protein